MKPKGYKATPVTARTKQPYKHKAPSLLKQTEEKEKSMWNKGGHLALDVLGMVPVVGNFADAANAAWYAGEGDYKNAAFSAAAALPGAGLGVGLAKLGLSGTKVAKGAMATQKLITKNKFAKSIADSKKLKNVDNWARNTRFGRNTERLANLAINTRKPLKTGRQLRTWEEGLEQSGANAKINNWVDSFVGSDPEKYNKPEKNIEKPVEKAIEKPAEKTKLNKSNASTDIIKKKSAKTSAQANWKKASKASGGNLSKLVKARNSAKKGSPEYAKAQNAINKAYGSKKRY
jgi:hypothetical protein